tara:strand:- start:280 stop:972 length:693 start_codon:yes stop_codon:yes gene_type:complete
MLKNKLFPIHEYFYSFQGEGVHIGKACTFIRTFGCPVHCPWCDSAGTWHKDYTPSDIKKYNFQELLTISQENKEAEFVVITGGEPALHDWTQFTTHSNKPVHIETSGGFPLRGEFDWITVSPKWDAKRNIKALMYADEIKIIVENKNSIYDWLADLTSIAFSDRLKAIWLHPEWSKRNDPEILGSINQAVRERGYPFRAGYQLHKLYKIDEEDSNSRKPIPLGGDIKLGY